MGTTYYSRGAACFRATRLFYFLLCARNFARSVVLNKMVMVSRLAVILTALGTRTWGFHIPAVSRTVLPSSSNKITQGSSCVASRGHRQRSCSQLEAKKKKKSALKGPASDALAQLELLEALEAEMEGAYVGPSSLLCSLSGSPSLPHPPIYPPAPRARTVTSLARRVPFAVPH